ncbi:flagellar biosynthetic protein FliO [Paenibacillus sp. N1-5-1-14]|uniref:flagellar biosynthetic protein FliO n=1 Tax=Paenibacillus radicibacter TaxID=2972488 RepID=UPI002158E5FC|nr:flagellar biosynthetic protein FliO [Paenibacillus radicibacter]MCR8642180.1 flagellar biosynthetic protein FliO [Paenibacillus radicibacter]
MRRRPTKLHLLTPSIAAFFVSFSTVAYASDELPSDVKGVGSSGSYDNFMLLMKVIGVLLLMLALFYGLMRLITRKNRMTKFGRSVRSMGGVPLGPNKSIQIVEIGHFLYIVGVGNDIRVLDKIDDPEEIAYITDVLAERTASPQFPSVMQWIQNLRNKNVETPSDDDVTASFQQVLAQKMKHTQNRNKRVEQLLQNKQSDADRLNDE